MALTLDTGPANINRSVSDSLRFAVTSDNVNEDQFALVYTVLEGTRVVATKRRQPNQFSTIHFDVSRIIDNDLSWDYAPLFGTSGADTNSNKSYTVEMREEFLVAGVLTLSGVLLTSASFQVFKGVQQRGGVAVGTGIELPGVVSQIDDAQRLNRADRQVITYYDEANDTLRHQVVTPPAQDGEFDVSISISGDESITYTFDAYTERSTFGEFAFAWINPETGGYDFHTTTLESESNTTVTKQSFTGSPFNLSETRPSNTEVGASNVFLGAEQSYNINYEEIFTTNTEWLSASQAAKIQGFLRAKKQWIQVDGNFLPITTMNGYAGFPNMRVQPNHHQPIAFRHDNQFRIIV